MITDKIFNSKLILSGSTEKACLIVSVILITHLPFWCDEDVRISCKPVQDISKRFSNGV